MIRFQCPHCRGIVASETWEAGAATVCAYCSEKVKMPEERLAPGMVIGDFLLIRKLGEGGMGVVYMAHQLSLDRTAAIKVLNAEFSQQAESVKAFIREARSAAKLNHPSIVQAYAVGEDDGIFYFAMEYIDGKTMKEVLLDTAKIAPEKAAKIVLQVAEALDCAWREQKIIHHDIKPDNIMQCSDDRVKLADLGLAGVQGEDANDDSDEVVGTPQYISPEQLTGVVTDTRSDIYSLGATLYHFVTGQFPYNGENTDEIARQHVYGTLVPPKNINPDLPQELNDIIVKMMAKTPDERFQNCAELSQALKSFIENAGKKQSSVSASGSVLKPAGGLSGGGTQIKIAAPGAGNKISIKAADKKVEEKSSAEPVAAPGQEAAGSAAAKPVIKLGVVPKKEEQRQAINLAGRKTEEESAGKAPETTAVQAENSTAEPSQTDKDAEAEQVEAAQDAAPVAENAADVQAESEVAAVEGDPAEVPEKSGGKKSGKWGWIISVVCVLLAVAGAGAWYYLTYMRNGNLAEKITEPESAKLPVVAKFVMPEAESPEVKQETAATPKTAVYTPPPKVKEPVLSAFMREARSLENIYLSNEASFVQAWKQRSGRLKPKSADETKFFESLDGNYVIADERVNIENARKPLIAAYNKKRDDFNRRKQLQENQQRVINAEKAALEFAEASPENYAADLERKMGLLDYAMITAARSRSAAAWQNFQKALTLAKNEPQRVAGREGFGKTAQKLADYAQRLEFVAEQGREFTAMLDNGKFKGKKIVGENATATVTAANRSRITFSVVTMPKIEAPKVAPKPKAKAKAPAKGKKPVAKAKTPPKAKPKPKAKPQPSKPKTHNIALIIKKPEEAKEVKGWVDLLERDMGRRDQYFYFMLYNGNLQHSIASIAPDKFWQKRVDKVMRSYFDRAIFIANDAQLAALQKSFNTWPVFQSALKDFKEKQ